MLANKRPVLPRAQALPMLLESGFSEAECSQIMQEVLWGSDPPGAASHATPVALAQQFEAEARRSLSMLTDTGTAAPQHHQLTVTHHHHHHTHAAAVSPPPLRPALSPRGMALLPPSLGHVDSTRASVDASDTGVHYGATNLRQSLADEAAGVRHDVRGGRKALPEGVECSLYVKSGAAGEERQDFCGVRLYSLESVREC